MSKRRPSQRDRLEREYLALCGQRSALDEKILGIQAHLDRMETPRLMEGSLETGPRKDALDFVPEGKVITLPNETAWDEPITEIAQEVETTDWRARCLRMTALATGILRRIAYAQNRPRLEAFAGLFALGVDCDSMRTVALAEGVSIEWVSQKTEEVRKRFNLPPNQHNKSAQAVGAYRESAKIGAMAS